MNPTGADKSAIDRILDAGVFAPLGLLITRDQVRDDVVAAGRKQVAFARSLGRAALQGFTRSAPAAPATPSAPVVVEVPGYDTMSARDVVTLLKAATTAQAQWIKAHESAGQGRVTILRAADSVLD